MERRKFVIGVGSLAAGGAAAMGTGAFTAAELSGRSANVGVVDDSNGLLGLEPGSTNLVEDGSGGNELEIDFNPAADGQGVNPNSVYQVGGLGGIGNLDEVPGDPDDGMTVEEVAIDTTTPIDDTYAFKLINQSGNDRDVELTYQANDSFPDDARVWMVADYDSGSGDPEQTSALVATATPNAREASIVYADDVDYSADVDSGTEVTVSIIVDAGDLSNGTDLGGQILVRAGDHDNFTDPNPPS